MTTGLYVLGEYVQCLQTYFNKINASFRETVCPIARNSFSQNTANFPNSMGPAPFPKRGVMGRSTPTTAFNLSQCPAKGMLACVPSKT